MKFNPIIFKALLSIEQLIQNLCLESLLFEKYKTCNVIRLLRKGIVEWGEYLLFLENDQSIAMTFKQFWDFIFIMEASKFTKIEKAHNLNHWTS